jgi:hypothetical protein
MFAVGINLKPEQFAKCFKRPQVIGDPAIPSSHMGLAACLIQ